MKTNVYIDGFNLYYGCLKGTPYRWLDLARLCQIMLPNHTINRTRYFTAFIQPRPGDPDKAQRQQTYLRAVETIPNLSVHYGHYLSNKVRMPLVTPPATGPKTVEVWETKEKGSDVNLATHLLVDGFDGDYEVAVVISNDSDLALPIKVVCGRLGLKVGLLNPRPNPSRALLQVATFYKRIRPGVLRMSQFPPTLTDRRGTITKPQGW